MTFRTLNRKLQPLGVELVQGRGYLYFSGLRAPWGTKMVLVPRLNRLTESEWIEEATDAARQLYCEAKP